MNERLPNHAKIARGGGAVFSRGNPIFLGEGG